MREFNWDQAITSCSPYPYTLAVSLDKSGKPNIIGIAWWSIVSWDPQMLMISVGHARYSYQCLKHLPQFTLNFPSEEMAKGAWLCGKVSGRETDKVKATGFALKDSEHVKPPILADSTVAFECDVVQQVETGDHTVFIANIKKIWGNPDKEMHLFTVHYKKMFSMDTKGNINLDLDY